MIHTCNIVNVCFKNEKSCIPINYFGTVENIALNSRIFERTIYLNAIRRNMANSLILFFRTFFIVPLDGGN